MFMPSLEVLRDHGSASTKLLLLEGIKVGCIEVVIK